MRVATVAGVTVTRPKMSTCDTLINGISRSVWPLDVTFRRSLTFRRTVSCWVMYKVLIVGSYAPSALLGATPFHGEDRRDRDCNPYTSAHRSPAVVGHRVVAL